MCRPARSVRSAAAATAASLEPVTNMNIKLIEYGKCKTMSCSVKGRYIHLWNSELLLGFHNTNVASI